jgi:hypothetical protein
MHIRPPRPLGGRQHRAPGGGPPAAPGAGGGGEVADFPIS